MATFKVVFRNALNSAGEITEVPADKLNANGAIIESYGFCEREIREGDPFARDTWEYVILDKDADRFTVGLNKTSNVLEHKKL